MKKYPHGLTLNAVCGAIDDYHATTLREKIDAAMLAAMP